MGRVNKMTISMLHCEVVKSRHFLLVSICVHMTKTFHSKGNVKYGEMNGLLYYKGVFTRILQLLYSTEYTCTVPARY